MIESAGDAFSRNGEGEFLDREKTRANGALKATMPIFAVVSNESAHPPERAAFASKRLSLTCFHVAATADLALSEHLASLLGSTAFACSRGDPKLERQFFERAEWTSFEAMSEELDELRERAQDMTQEEMSEAIAKVKRMSDVFTNKD